MPEPVTVRLTVVEAAAAQVLLAQFDDALGEQMPAPARRAAAALATALRRAGCVMDADGWRA